MAIMSTHDTIIGSHIINTVQANKKQAMANYQEGDLVYLSTRNISLPKGLARKLAPKYLGPFVITKVLKEGATYQLDLSEELVKRGINPAFHALLLKPHIPNDDRCFPRRLPSQILGFGKHPDEWVIKVIVDYHGKGINSEFQIVWKVGNKTWAPYQEVAHLIALERYCELVGVKEPVELPAKQNSEEVRAQSINIYSVKILNEYKGGNKMGKSLSIPTMPHKLSYREYLACAAYSQRLHNSNHGLCSPPTGPPPPGYNEYILISSNNGFPANPYDTYPYNGHHSNGGHSNVKSGNISMPPSAFTHMMDSQVRTVELMTGYRSPHYNHNHAKPYFPHRGGIITTGNHYLLSKV